MIYKSVYISFLLICLVFGFLSVLCFPPNSEQHFPPSHRPWGAVLLPPILRLSHLLGWNRSLVCPLPPAPHPSHQSYFGGRQLTAPALSRHADSRERHLLSSWEDLRFLNGGHKERQLGCDMPLLSPAFPFNVDTNFQLTSGHADFVLGRSHVVTQLSRRRDLGAAGARRSMLWCHQCVCLLETAPACSPRKGGLLSLGVSTSWTPGESKAAPSP